MSLNALLLIGIIVFLLILMLTLTSVKWAYRFEHKIDAVPDTVDQKQKGD